VAFTTNSTEYLAVKEQWEKEFKLNLEEDNFDLFIQKDVNNYIGVKGDYIKCKGGDVNKFSGDKYFSNNNARIIDIAVVNKLVHNKDVLETLIENRKKYQNINRVFACRNNGIQLSKKRLDGGLVKFADAPEKMFLWNDDCSKLENFEKIVDLNHYYQIINKKLTMWEI